jgi:hypothetical protein
MRHELPSVAQRARTARLRLNARLMARDMALDMNTYTPIGMLLEARAAQPIKFAARLAHELRQLPVPDDRRVCGVPAPAQYHSNALQCSEGHDVARRVCAAGLGGPQPRWGRPIDRARQAQPDAAALVADLVYAAYMASMAAPPVRRWAGDGSAMGARSEHDGGAR